MQNEQVWFITGASSGFGRAFAEYALSQQYRVVATARNLQALNKLAAEHEGRVLPLRMDVTDEAQVKQCAEQAVAHFGRIDVLINNAGYGIVGAVEETPESELRALMETNFFGAVSVTRALLPQFRAQKSGAIVNISSMGGQLAFPGFGAYAASKFALEGISEALAQELRPLGIKVLIVEPGQFRTDLAGNAMRHMAEIAGYSESVGPIRQFARAMHGTQAGDPLKAARAIEVALQAEETPLRLQLGRDAVDAIRGHAEKLIADLNRWEKVAVDTAFAE